MQNNSNQSVVSEVTWQISLKWGGEYRTSPTYPTYEEALKNVGKFLKQFQGKYLNVTFVRNVRYITRG